MDEDDLDKKTQKRGRKRRKKQQLTNLFDFPGVKKIILTELTQKIIECVVGEHVSSEEPWKYVKKELVADNLELHEESSEFLPIRREIMNYPGELILIGYNCDDTQDDDDEFFICVTEEATKQAEVIIKNLKQEQEERLQNQLYKEYMPWVSLGSEIEVDESINRNLRPLLEIEIESKYPIFPGKAHFKIWPVDSKRDGYMELLGTYDENLQSINMRRVDNATQVSPPVVSSGAQTIIPYPKNATTEYVYELPPLEEIVSHLGPMVVKYANKHFENITDMLQVNGTINFYTNDFDSLVKNKNLILDEDRRNAAEEFVEYLSFMDVDLCKEKMISDIYWHQMWTGIVAVAYCDASAKTFYNGPRHKHITVNATHLVLIWSFVDALQPKLILESPRQVEKLSFCKFDENVLVGGCNNGQIIIWDIKNKLQQVEEKEVLTPAQQKYRAYIKSLMGWMMDTHDISIVRPAAVSDLRFSHKAAVTAISWMDPRYEFSRTGTLNLIPPPDEDTDPQRTSMQFITTSLDGAIMIWDLLDKPIIQAGGYKPKKLQRLAKKPSALAVHVSPYRVLHLVLKPRYRVNVKNTLNKNVGITTATGGFCPLMYEEVEPRGDRKFDIKDRLYYKPQYKDVVEVETRLKLGTAEGEYGVHRWEGQDFDSGEIVNSENGQFVFNIKFHDGPVSTVQLNHNNGTSLTVGGKIFALWRDDLPGRPIIWRRSRSFFTKGEFNHEHPFKIIVHSITGQLSRWILCLNSKSPVFTKALSNSFLTATAMHPFKMEKHVYGVAEEQGSYRLFFIKQESDKYADTVSKSMDQFIEREVNRKKLFLKWQEEFNKRNKDYLEMKKQVEEEKAKNEMLKQETSKEEPKSEKLEKKGPLPGKYSEWLMEQKKIREEARIRAMIINKKQLDTKELEKRRKPLQKLEEENERKKKKQKERLKQGESIFKDTVASLFPEVMKEKPVPPPNPYSAIVDRHDKESCFKQYMSLVGETEDFIEQHPLEFEFNFKSLLVASKIRDDKIFQSHKHTQRYKLEHENEDLPVIEAEKQDEEVDEPAEDT